MLIMSGNDGNTITSSFTFGLHDLECSTLDTDNWITNPNIQYLRKLFNQNYETQNFLARGKFPVKLVYCNFIMNTILYS
jgi:hypothetical protein